METEGNDNFDLIDQQLKRTAKELEQNKRKLEAQSNEIMNDLSDYSSKKVYKYKLKGNNKNENDNEPSILYDEEDDVGSNVIIEKEITSNKLNNSKIEYEEENTKNNIPIKYSNSNDNLFSINKRINDINELSEKYNWGIKPNALKLSSNKNEEPSMKETSFLPSKSSLQNKYKSYSSDSYSSRLGGKNDQELPPKKYENNYILGTNLHEGRSNYSNSETTSSPYLKDSPYLSSNKKILYGDDYDNISNPKKKYSNKNLMFDTEELGKELDNLLDHIRTTRNNTTYGLFDKKYKYSKSYSYGHSSLGKDFYNSPRTNSVGNNQEYASKGYSSLSSSKPYYSQSYLMNNDRDSKYGNFIEKINNNIINENLIYLR